MPAGLILGLDQGTSSTRCVVLDRSLVEHGSAAVPVAAAFPGPGLVEQDAGALLDSARGAVAEALAAAGAAREDVAAVGIANQTETFVLAERESGRAIHPAVVWQDRRTAARCAELSAAGHGDWVRARTGLELDATFPASKIGWVLDRVNGTRARAAGGELVYHDIGGWLARHLCGPELCDAGNAGRTLLCRLGGHDWDDELLALFGIPRALMPRIVDSDGVARAAAQTPPPAGALPVTAILGDQQASLFGLGCRRPGMAKVTLGTGAFILAHAGREVPEPPLGVLASCAWRLGGETSYALEGFVPAAGSALDWFASVGALPAAAALDALLAGDAGGDDGSVVCVPALQGLGTPSWAAGTHGTLLGLTRASTRAQLARAVIDGVLHQVADALDAIAVATPLGSLLLDGGMARSDWIVQRLAELTGVRVERAARGEATAIGAAMVAGLAAGVWRDAGELPAVEVDRVAAPTWPARERAARRKRWSEAVALAARW
jgi:glycerol kinase